MVDQVTTYFGDLPLAGPLFEYVELLAFVEAVPPIAEEVGLLLLVEVLAHHDESVAGNSLFENKNGKAGLSELFVAGVDFDVIVLAVCDLVGLDFGGSKVPVNLRVECQVLVVDNDGVVHPLHIED